MKHGEIEFDGQRITARKHTLLGTTTSTPSMAVHPPGLKIEDHHDQCGGGPSRLDTDYHSPLFFFFLWSSGWDLDSVSSLLTIAP